MSFDLLLSGTSVKTYAQIMSWDGLLSGAPLRGDDPVVPLRRGALGVAKVRDAYTFSVPLVILGASQGAYQDALDTLRRLSDSSAGPITVTRVKPSAAGDVTTTCSAHCDLLESAMVNGLVNGRVVLDIRNLDGVWYGAAATPTIPATITVAGTTRTRRITLTLPGAGTLTNTTLGVSVTVTTAATLDVQAFTATAGLATLTQSGSDYWFELAPGSNAITWSGAGTPTISFAPAYL